MNTSRFNRTLRRYLRNEMPENEKAEFDRWLDSLSSKENEDQVQWNETDQANTLNKIKNRMNNPKKNMISPAKSNLFWVKLAASVILLLISTWILIPRVFNPVMNITEYSPEGTRKTFLNDGTLVWLNENSKLSYTENADGSERLATLTGEGLFEVAKDPTRPFTIQCGEVTVKVLGTSFSLKTNLNSIELKVLTGKVNISSTTDSVGIDLEPNQMVIYNLNKPAEIVSMTEEDVKNIIGIGEYKMEFKDEPMNTILKRIENKFDVKIDVANEHLTTCRLTADFTDYSLEGTLQMLAEVLDIQYEVKPGSVRIAGSGCP